MAPRNAAGRDAAPPTLPLGAGALNVRGDKDRRGGCCPRQRAGVGSGAMATAAPAGTDARDIFGEVVESLVHERPLAETLTLICRRVCDLGAFDFCGILLPDAERDHVHLAGSHGFPPLYITRLNDLFLAPLQDAELAASPTASALRHRETAVLTDALRDESFRPWRPLARGVGSRPPVPPPPGPH